MTGHIHPRHVRIGDRRPQTRARRRSPDPADAPTDRSPRDSIYYQLTHDYLVPSLRQWLARKRKETRRGRAELRLAERAALWNAKPERQQLPSLLKYLNIRTLTARKNWSNSHRKMMRRAGRYHLVRSAAVAILVAILAAAGLETYSFLRVGALATAETSEVPRIINGLPRFFRHWADYRLNSMLRDGAEDSKERLHASIAVLRTDPSQVDYLARRLLAASPDQFFVLRDELRPHRDAIRQTLWQLLRTPSFPPILGKMPKG